MAKKKQIEKAINIPPSTVAIKLTVVILLDLPADLAAVSVKKIPREKSIIRKTKGLFSIFSPYLKNPGTNFSLSEYTTMQIIVMDINKKIVADVRAHFLPKDK
jgi:hypothetical protein